MSTASPQAQVQPNHHRVPVRTPHVAGRELRLHHMKPGDLFLANPDRNRALALLTHEKVDVRDAKQIWVVVIHAQAWSGTPAGHIFALPHDAPVTRLTTLSPPQLMPEA